jgi:hypothetical protein
VTTPIVRTTDGSRIKLGPEHEKLVEKIKAATAQVENKVKRYHPADDDAALLAEINAAVASVKEAERNLKTVVRERSRIVGQLLLEAKNLHPAVKDFEAFLSRVDGSPKLAWAYVLMKLAGGRISEEEIKQDARDRQRKSRDSKRKLSSPAPVSVTPPLSQKVLFRTRLTLSKL